MFHQKIKSLFSFSVFSVVSDISQYTVNPGKDLTRNKKLPADKLISSLVSQGSSSTNNELLDFFSMDVLAPTVNCKYFLSKKQCTFLSYNKHLSF